MRRYIDRLKQLKSDTSGNALMLAALGMPVLMGGTGFAVDTAQYYMWKRELQFATDQAALAGAWARTEAATQDTYVDRAKQEFTVNVGVLTGATTEPVITLADYDAGTDNSVSVSASASRSLPFTSYLLDRTITVSAQAQATFEAATDFKTCLLALDKVASGAFTLGGSASGTVDCGAGALSTASEAMTKNGNPATGLGYLVAGGGIDSNFSANGELNPNVANLTDPYENLTPPQAVNSQTYSCPTASGTNSSSSKTATVTTTTTTTYTYWQGKNQNQADKQVDYTGAGAQQNPAPSHEVEDDQEVGSGVTEGSSDAPENIFDNWTGNSWAVSGSKHQKVFEYKRVTEQRTYTNVVNASDDSSGSSGSSTYTVSPGTYTGISIGCDTYFLPGVYTVNGVLDFGTGHTVTGTDVMFVITGTGDERTKINAGSVVNMSGITKDTLTTTYGVAADVAEKLNGMLIYDPVSTAEVRFNGHAKVGLNGIVYMPNRAGKFNGNATMAGSCMILALKSLHFTGNNSLDSFCLSSGTTGIDIGGSTVKVRLVA